MFSCYGFEAAGAMIIQGVPKKTAPLGVVGHFSNMSASRIGRANYNLHGTKEGLGLVPVTDKFFDSFLLQLGVPDYRIVGGRRYQQIGASNSTIKRLCSDAGLHATAKTVGFQHTRK